ncbi:DNA polymerase III subunit delta' [bacterium]|nr:DNA polymerase III subunit delta' [bacterium]
MSFNDIIGQEIAVKLLQNSLKHGRIPHAYMFIGPYGVGKRLAAINLAKALNCEGVSEIPCDRCACCKKIDAYMHPDVKCVYPTGSSLSITIDNIRELRTQISFKTYEGKKKIYIIAEAENMTIQAANCILKTLEEPPENSVLILTSTSSHLLLQTIVSRCQAVPFIRIELHRIENFLVEHHRVDKSLAHFIANLSQGSLGEALKLKDDAQIPLVKSRLMDMLSRLKNEDVITLVGEFNKEVFNNGDSERSRDVREYRNKLHMSLDMLTTCLRDIAILKQAGEQVSLINLDISEDLKQLESKFSLSQIERFLDTITDMKAYVRNNVSSQLILEKLFLDIQGKVDA